MIPQKNNVITILTIVHYEDYQADDTTDDTTERPQKDHRKTDTIRVNKVNKEKEGGVCETNKNSFEYISSREFLKSILENGYFCRYEITPALIRRTFESIQDYVSSKGKKPYKDIPATIRSWLRKDCENEKIRKIEVEEIEDHRKDQYRNLEIYEESLKNDTA